MDVVSPTPPATRKVMTLQYETLTPKWQNSSSRKLYSMCICTFCFGPCPIRLHGGGRVYDIYRSQPPGGDQDTSGGCHVSIFVNSLMKWALKAQQSYLFTTSCCSGMFEKQLWSSIIQLFDCTCCTSVNYSLNKVTQKSISVAPRQNEKLPPARVQSEELCFIGVALKKCMIQNIYLCFSSKDWGCKSPMMSSKWMVSFQKCMHGTKPPPSVQLERLFSWICYEMLVDKYKNMNTESILLYELTHLICWLKAHSSKLLCVTACVCLCVSVCVCVCALYISAT